MKKYRVIRRGGLYYPQFRFMWIFWLYFTCEHPRMHDEFITPSFSTLEEAKKYIEKNKHTPRYKFKQVVEYVD